MFNYSTPGTKIQHFLNGLTLFRLVTL